MMKTGLFSVTLVCLFVFLSMGNLFRLIPSSLFSDSLSLSEGLLYFFSLISAFFLRSFYRVACIFCCLFGAFFLSFLYGCHVQGWNLIAGLYAVRFALLFSSCFILAEICFDFFEGSFIRLCEFFCKIYFVAVFLGFILYFFFPESSLLWQMLDEYHIGFQGDPHVGRFVSVYFDPNYYCSIAALCFLIAWYLYETTQKKRYAFLGLLCFISSLFSWSRSGLFVWVCLILYRLGIAWFRACFSKRHLCFVGTFVSICLLGAIFYGQELAIFWDRTFYFFDDVSALCRLRTFEFGLDLLKQYPLFGVGMNYLYIYTTEEIGLNSLDSSLLALLVQIGWVPFLLVAFYSAYKAFSLRVLNRVWQSQENRSSYFFSWFCLYGFLIVFFASQFNNLLFYPFWVVPFGVIFIFTVKVLLRKKSDSSVQKIV